MFHCFLHPSVCDVCLVRCGRDCARECAGVIHSDALPNHCTPTKRKTQFTKPVVDTDFPPECTLRRCAIVIRIRSIMSVFLVEHQYLRICLCDDVAPMSHQRWHLDPFQACLSTILLSDVLFFLTWVHVESSLVHRHFP